MHWPLASLGLGCKAPRDRRCTRGRLGSARAHLCAAPAPPGGTPRIRGPAPPPARRGGERGGVRLECLIDSQVMEDDGSPRALGGPRWQSDGVSCRAAHPLLPVGLPLTLFGAAVSLPRVSARGRQCLSSCAVGSTLAISQRPPDAQHQPVPTVWTSQSCAGSCLRNALWAPDAREQCVVRCDGESGICDSQPRSKARGEGGGGGGLAQGLGGGGGGVIGCQVDHIDFIQLRASRPSPPHPSPSITPTPLTLFPLPLGRRPPAMSAGVVDVGQRRDPLGPQCRRPLSSCLGSPPAIPPPIRPDSPSTEVRTHRTHALSLAVFPSSGVCRPLPYPFACTGVPQAI